jgi:hypothetical protein
MTAVGWSPDFTGSPDGVRDDDTSVVLVRFRVVTVL